MLIKFEGFDHETAVADLYAGILTTLIAGTGQTATLGLNGNTQYGAGQCLTVTATNPANSAANAFTVLPITPAANTVIVGASVSLSASPTNGVVIGFCNNNVGQVFCYIGGGGVNIFRGDPTTTSVQLGNPISNVVASVGWGYVELKAVIATGTAGSVQVQINGTTVFNQTGLNTAADGTTGVNGVLLGSANTAQTSAGATAAFDDVYAVDPTGVQPHNTFLGPVRVVTQFPSANGSITSFTGLALHPNWQNVSQLMDNDTSYNFSNTTGSIDSFRAPILPATASGVFAVKVCGAGRIDDAGLRTVQTYIASSNNATATGASVNLGGSYQYFSDIFTVDPNTTQLWTTSAVNALQFGYKIVPSAGIPVAIAAVTLRPQVGATMQQSDMLAATATFRISSVSVITAVITVSVVIGTFSVQAQAQQTDLVTARGQLNVLLTPACVLTLGLYAAGSATVQIKLSSAISLSTPMSAQVVMAAPRGGAVLLPGMALLGSGTLLPQVSAALAQKVLASASITLPLKPAVSAVHSAQISGRGQIAAFSATGIAVAPLASNIHSGLSPWAANHTYVSGARVAATFAGVTNAYQATASGSSASTPPSGTGSFTDGAVTWKYLSHVDFIDLASWAASIPAVLTLPVVGMVWNNGTITTTAGTPFLTLGQVATPRGTSSVNTITLRAAPGEGIRDSLASGTVPLTFDASKGASFTLPTGTGGINYFDIADGNVIIDGLQFRDPNPTSGSGLLHQENSSSSLTISNCIIDGFGQTAGNVIVQGGTKTFSLVNSLIIDRQTTANISTATINLQSANNRVVNCTVIGGLQAGTPAALTPLPGAFSISQVIATAVTAPSLHFSLAVTWNAAPSTVTPITYNVFLLQVVSSLSYNVVAVSTAVSGTSTTFSNPLAPSTTYLVQVSANNSNGSSPNNLVATLTFTLPAVATTTTFFGPVNAAITANAAAAVVSNTIIMGYNTSIGGSSGAIVQADHSLFSTATVGFGGVDNGANLFAKPAANQFNSVTADFRLKATSDALDVGATAISDIPSASDIAGTHRPSGIAWDIGCSER